MNKLLVQSLNKYDIDSLLHVGAHKGQEVNFYQNLNIKNVLFSEFLNYFSKIHNYKKIVKTILKI